MIHFWIGCLYGIIGYMGVKLAGIDTVVVFTWQFWAIVIGLCFVKFIITLPDKIFKGKTND